jgi:hypothetical protein
LELVRVELVVCVASHDAAHHQQDARLVCLGDEEAEGFGLIRRLGTLVRAEPQARLDARRGPFDAAFRSCRSHERKRRLALDIGELPAPLLTLLAEVDGVEQAGAGPFKTRASPGAEVRDRNALLGRFRKEEETYRHVRRLRKLLDLPERRNNLAAFPLFQLGKTPGQRSWREAAALACPAQQVGFYLSAHSVPTLALLRWRFNGGRTIRIPDLDCARYRGGDEHGATLFKEGDGAPRRGGQRAGRCPPPRTSESAADRNLERPKVLRSDEVGCIMNDAREIAFPVQMIIETVIPCVHYDDFLRLTLPRNMRQLDRVTVLTSPEDTASIEVATGCGAKVLTTDAWWQGRFNKGRALNEWLDSVSPASGPDVWYLVMDADVVLPCRQPLGERVLDPRVLYGARRRMCDDQSGWHEFSSGARGLESFPLDFALVWHGRVWNLPTVNPAALYGCLQLWNSAHGSGAKRFREFPTAAAYDVAFALSFGEDHRAFLPDFEVLHLGESRTNWGGRRSARWQASSPELPIHG